MSADNCWNERRASMGRGRTERGAAQTAAAFLQCADVRARTIRFRRCLYLEDYRGERGQHRGSKLIAVNVTRTARSGRRRSRSVERATLLRGSMASRGGCESVFGQVIDAWRDIEPTRSGDLYLQNVNPDGTSGRHRGAPRPSTSISVPGRMATPPASLPLLHDGSGRAFRSCLRHLTATARSKCE